MDGKIRYCKDVYYLQTDLQIQSYPNKNPSKLFFPGGRKILVLKYTG